VPVVNHPSTENAQIEAVRYLAQIWQDYLQLSEAKAEDCDRARRLLYSRIAAIPDVLFKLRGEGRQPDLPSRELHCTFCDNEVAHCKCADTHPDVSSERDNDRRPIVRTSSIPWD